LAGGFWEIQRSGVIRASGVGHIDRAIERPLPVVSTRRVRSHSISDIARPRQPFDATEGVTPLRSTDA